MQVQIGPLPSGSVLAWVGYARRILRDRLASPPTPDAPALDPGAVAGFTAFLDAWEATAGERDEFLWLGDVDQEQVEYLVHTWFGLAAALADEAEARGYPLAPPEGDAFYQALVTAVLDALAHDGRALAEFSEQLRDRWPGLKEP